MNSYRTIADAYGRALVFGIVDAAEVVAWTDSVIMAEPHPAYAFIEASCSGGDPEKLLNALREVPGVSDPVARRRMIFGMMLQALNRDPENVKNIVTALYTMALSGDVPDSDGEMLMFRLDDELDLAERGIYSSKDDVIRELKLFLVQYGN